MSRVTVKMNMSALVEIANQCNEKVALPLAQKIAARAGGGADYSVEQWRRPGVSGWARTQVFTATPEAMAREVRAGALARAFGGA